MRWIRRLLWWKHPDVEHDQAERDGKVAELSQQTQEGIARSDRVVEEVKQMRRALRR